MKTQRNLPENYQTLFHIDLQKDKKLALLVNGLALAITLLMAVAGFAFHPIEAIPGPGKAGSGFGTSLRSSTSAAQRGICMSPYGFLNCPRTFWCRTPELP